MKTNATLDMTVEQYTEWLSTNPTGDQILAYLKLQAGAIYGRLKKMVGIKTRSCLTPMGVKTTYPVGREGFVPLLSRAHWLARIDRELLDTQIHIENLCKEESLAEEVYTINRHNGLKAYGLKKIQDEIEAEEFLVKVQTILCHR